MKPGADLSKMNPALAAPSGGMVGSGAMGRGPRDRHIGLTVTVVKGPHKGYVGTIKDTNGQIARVELRTGNKIIMIDKEKLYRRLYAFPVFSVIRLLTSERRPDGKLEPLDGRGSRQSHGGTANPYSGSNTPSTGGAFNANPWNAGRTPNPYADGSGGGGKTPAWNVSGRTPNPYVAEPTAGKTPAWNVSSRTPNPYADGGRTPSWKTPAGNANPYATGANAGAGTGTGWGGATPGRTSAWGGATPGRQLSTAADSGWGSSGTGASAGWGSPSRASSAWDAPSSWVSLHSH